MRDRTQVHRVWSSPRPTTGPIFFRKRKDIIVESSDTGTDKKKIISSIFSFGSLPGIFLFFVSESGRHRDAAVVVRELRSPVCEK